MTNRVPAPTTLALLALAALAPRPSQADTPPLPALQPLPPPLPQPADTDYPGTLRLAVDATDLARHVFAVHESLPVEQTASGSGTHDLILLYPQWIPGNHGPTGPIQQLAGLTVRAGTTALPWRRDPVDMYAFHVAVPDGTTTVDIDFQFLSPLTPAEGRVVMTPDMLDLQWNTVVLYPAGHALRGITTDPSLHLPEGWQAGTALTPAGAASTGASSNTLHFAPVPLNVLFDSPLIAGRNFSRLDLNPTPTPTAPAPVHLDIVADTPSELAVSPAQLAIHRALVTQASRLFGAHHYDHYDFLLCLSDELSGEGLEHHRSSEDCTGGTYFTDWSGTWADRDLLSHEYTHSWNGKYRRPADLYSPDLDVIPERDSLLWVYEGGTEYWGQVLAARSGLWSHQQALDALAVDAAIEQDETGRAWRPLEDTTNDPIFLRRRDTPWLTWERSEDYYIEGVLLWLDADTLIRAKTNNAKSLDDFAHLFFGQHDGDWDVSTYRFDDIVAALTRIVPYDWATFLHDHLDRIEATAPLDGITRGGYRLVYDATPNAFITSYEKLRHERGFEASVGLVTSPGADGLVQSVGWGTPAWHAGLIEGSTILAIGDIAYTGPDDLSAAIKAAAHDHQPIRLLVRTGRHVHNVAISYDGGLRYPHLVRDTASTAPSSLDAIIAAKP